MRSLLGRRRWQIRAVLCRPVEMLIEVLVQLGLVEVRDQRAELGEPLAEGDDRERRPYHQRVLRRGQIRQCEFGERRPRVAVIGRQPAWERRVPPRMALALDGGSESIRVPPARGDVAREIRDRDEGGIGRLADISLMVTLAPELIPGRLIIPPGGKPTQDGCRVVR